MWGVRRARRHACGRVEAQVNEGHVHKVDWTINTRISRVFTSDCEVELCEGVEGFGEGGGVVGLHVVTAVS